MVMNLMSLFAFAISPVSLLAAMTDTSAITWWGYGARGQVLTETRSITVTTGVTTPTPASFTTLYDYDSVGRIITTTYPDGDSHSYHRAAAAHFKPRSSTG